MDKQNKSDMIIYNDGELELSLSVNDETLWLTQKQIAELFQVTIPNINMHIKSIYKEEELFENRTIQKYLIVQKEGKREVKREVEHYNLDVVLSVGYRVNSKKATTFRQWATKILKSYITDGYVINSDKITNDRFVSLENEVVLLKSKVENISNGLENTTLKPKQGVLFDGQIYDAYVFINDLLKSAKSEVVLIDNYIDETVFTLFSKYPNLKIKIYTQITSKQLRLDFQKYNAQYQNIELAEFKKSHDRFLILDEKEIYHIGASLKDLGKKWFAFSLLDLDSFQGGFLDKIVFRKFK
ncbi:virulence RhuM family protein [Arcobacter sp. FWKO B]|uniref:virulence RhuM family protein n=1 Tax=Arcobacter sp. FWKO B TaxID=2593672 RepID=UPI0018A688FA|nr:RhuM family protein [Arcobacter sp. FWKO B]QOG12602.1 DNA-binding protein [Arcobacter sp. FWKO B]